MKTCAFSELKQFPHEYVDYLAGKGFTCYPSGGAATGVGDGFIWPEEAEALAHIAGATAHSGFALELGTYKGYSAALMALVRRAEAGYPGYTVDHYAVDGSSLKAVEGKIEVLGLKHWLFPLTGDTCSAEVAVQIPRRVSLLFVDATHTEEAIKAEVLAFTPHLDGKAVVLFHDYTRASGVERAALDLFATKPHSLMGVVGTMAVFHWTDRDLWSGGRFSRG